jgi:hypothetical protein
MLDLGSTSFVISPEAATAFKIPVVQREKQIKVKDVSAQKMTTTGLFTFPLGLSFGNHRSFNEEDHAFEVMKVTGDYDGQIQAWYLEQHKVRGTTTSHLNCPHCNNEGYGHEKLHPEYSLTYDKLVSINEKAIHIGAVVCSNPDILRKLPACYHQFMFLFDPEEAEKLPDN